MAEPIEKSFTHQIDTTELDSFSESQQNDHEKSFTHQIDTNELDSFSKSEQNDQPDRVTEMEAALTVLETLCPFCKHAGRTRFLPTHIPYFRKIVLITFKCNECGYKLNEVESVNELADLGCRYTLGVAVAHGQQNDARTKELLNSKRKQDLNRQIIRSETATIAFKEIDFEMPPLMKRGDISTVEGIITRIIENLENDQPSRKNQDQTIAEKIQQVIDTFKRYISGEEPFTLVLDDPSGNSYLENPEAPKPDPRAQVLFYPRTKQQTEALGYQNAEEDERNVRTDMNANSSYLVSSDVAEKLDTYFDVTDRSAAIPGICHNCHQSCETRMAITELPHFKDIILMVTECEHCGFKDAEVKPAGAISKYALKITLTVNSLNDLKRDVMKSDTSALYVPEIGLELTAGTLGGKYSTVEGIMADIRQQLENTNPFALGDSATQHHGEQSEGGGMAEFLRNFDELLTCKRPWTFILDDPLANIYIYREDENDTQVKIEKYERTHEQNEELGLNDIRVDNYLTSEQRDELIRIEAEEASTDNISEMNETQFERMQLFDPNAQVDEALSGSASPQKAVKVGGLIKPNEHDPEPIFPN